MVFRFEHAQWMQKPVGRNFTAHGGLVPCEELDARGCVGQFVHAVVMRLHHEGVVVLHHGDVASEMSLESSPGTQDFQIESIVRHRRSSGPGGRMGGLPTTRRNPCFSNPAYDVSRGGVRQ